MNQDMLLDATPASARRLIRLSRLIDVEVAPEIRVLATQDNDLPGLFPTLSDRQRAAARFVLDCDLRALIPSRDVAAVREVVLAACLSAGHRRITIVMNGPTLPWHRVVREYGLTALHAGEVIDETAEVLFVDPNAVTTEALHSAEMGRRRDGVLVMDHTGNAGVPFSAPESMLPREFARTLVIGDPMLQTAVDRQPWTPLLVQMSQQLFPSVSEHRILANDLTTRVALFKSRGIVRNHPRDVAFLLNCCADLMPDPNPVFETQEYARMEKPSLRL